MVTWYECKVKYRKTFDTGEEKPVTETYLLDAISYSEAEARITEEMKAYTEQEFKITNIKVSNISEVYTFEVGDRWFKSKIALIAVDEESGKERKTNVYFLVQANDVKEAFDNTNEAMKDTLGDYTIPSITESPILEVFPYFTGEEEQLEKFNVIEKTITEDVINQEEE